MIQQGSVGVPVGGMLYARTANRCGHSASSSRPPRGLSEASRVVTVATRFNYCRLALASTKLLLECSQAGLDRIEFGLESSAVGAGFVASHAHVIERVANVA